MFLLVPAHPDCPRQNPESCKMVIVVVVVVVVVLWKSIHKVRLPF